MEIKGFIKKKNSLLYIMLSFPSNTTQSQKIAKGYIRVSTIMQKEEGVNLETQIQKNNSNQYLF